MHKGIKAKGNRLTKLRLIVAKEKTKEGIVKSSLLGLLYTFSNLKNAKLTGEMFRFVQNSILSLCIFRLKRNYEFFLIYSSVSNLFLLGL